MERPKDERSPEQLLTIGAMSGAEATELGGLDAEAVVSWLAGDAGFVAGLNRAKTYRAERLRADVRALASDAVATLRELVSGPDIPPAVRLRASLAVNAELIGLYWHVGRDILDRQARVGWSGKVIERLASDLRAEFPDMRGLSRASAPSEAWPDTAVVQRVVGQLPWGRTSSCWPS